MPDDHSYTDDDEYREGTYGDDDVVGREEYREDAYEEDDAYGDEAYGADEYGGYEEEEGGSWWDEGLIGLLLVAGVVLFFFPEPFTSTIGIILIGLGVLAWVADALM